MRIGARATTATATTLGAMYAGRKTATPTSASVAAMADARTTGKLIQIGSYGDGVRYILCRSVDVLEAEEAHGVVEEDVVLLLRAEEGRRFNRFDGHSDGIDPDHLV